MIKVRRFAILIGVPIFIFCSVTMAFGISSEIEISNQIANNKYSNVVGIDMISSTENWGQVVKLSALNGMENDFFGTSVSISGNTLAVGGTNSLGFQGGVFIFEQDAGGPLQWGQVVTLTNASPGTAYGVAVDLDGDTLAVGAHSAFGNGAVYIYERNQNGPNNWGVVKTITSPNPGTGDLLGFALSLEGDRLLVGASEATINTNIAQGAAYIFERNEGGSNNWGLIKELLATDGEEFDTFGQTVSLSGERAAIGASVDIGTNDNQGAIYIFERNTGGPANWGQVISVTNASGVSSYYPSSISLNGDTLAARTDADELIFFEKDRGGVNNWGLVPTSIVPGSSLYGFDLDGDRVAISLTAPDNRGKVNIYGRNEGGQDNWGLVAEMTTVDIPDGASFNLSQSGNNIAIASPYMTINGNANQGGCYIFGEQGFMIYLPSILKNSE